MNGKAPSVLKAGNALGKLPPVSVWFSVSKRSV
jgi:hypothetical protein